MRAIAKRDRGDVDRLSMTALDNLARRPRTTLRTHRKGAIHERMAVAPHASADNQVIILT
jgi:hypothetical protein